MAFYFCGFSPPFHRMNGLGWKEPKSSSSFKFLPWAGTSWLWTLPEMGKPQLHNIIYYNYKRRKLMEKKEMEKIHSEGEDFQKWKRADGFHDVTPNQQIKSGQDLQGIGGNISVPRWVIARSDLPKQPETKLRKWDFLLSSCLTSAVNSERK